MSDTIRLDDVRDIPDMSLTDEKIAEMLAAENANHQGGWDRIDLTDEQYAQPPDPPAVLDLIYRGRRHVLSGAPETAKTLIAYITTITAIRDGWTCAIIDFEMGPTATRRMLTDLGATLQEISDLYYVTPNNPPADNLACIIDHHPQLVTIDAAIGAYDAQDLDDNRRQDAEKFATTWITPLWRAGIATLLVDHVTKNIDNRGKFTIGSERKLGSADVHLGLEALKTISRGGTGLIKVHVHKDRPGFLPRPTATVVELDSDETTHRISWQMREPIPTDQDGGMKHTIYWERISRELESHDNGPRSQTQIEEAITGKPVYIRDALREMLEEGLVTVDTGPRNASLYTLISTYRRPEDDPVPDADPDPVPDPVPPRPDGDPRPRPTPSPPYRGTGVADSTKDAVTPSPEIDVYDPAVQAKLDGYDSDIPF